MWEQNPFLLSAYIIHLIILLSLFIRSLMMVDYIVFVVVLYGCYCGWFKLQDEIKKIENKEKEIFRKSEDEHDLTDWG